MDDTLAVATKDFMKLKEKIPEKLESKPRAFSPFIFAGVITNTNPEGYFLEHNE